MALFSSFGETNLDALSKEITDYAVDIFVYDTRKDSDGGKWRKRTKKTSWYNETLNTATRGSRREFPAVAVIVAEATQVTIYDGDDPDLPMWMVFNVSNTTWLKHFTSASNCSCVTALNGEMVTGGNGAGIRLSVVRFIHDNGYVSEASFTYRHEYISTRNSTPVGPVDTANPRNIVNNQINDVAMTVLPNAPIDPDTGLPIPTIAVATDGGVSIIRDDGTVTNQTHSKSSDSVSRFIDINSSGIVRYGVRSYGSKPPGNFYIYSNSDLNSRTTRPDRLYTFLSPVVNNYEYPLVTTNNGYTTSLYGIKNIGVNEFVVGTAYYPSLGQSDNGIYKVIESEGSSNNIPTVANITTTYNTGWMHGDIKGAFLSDNVTENLTRTNLLTNGTFETTTGWSGATGGILSINGSNQLVITNANGSSNGRAISNSFSTVAGKQYLYTVDAISSTGGATFRMEVRGPELVYTSFTAGETGQIYFTGNGNTMYVELYCIGGSGLTITYDNAFVVECEEDRSVINRGLEVFGTVTKQPVVNGADLVSYSGFSNSGSGTYLEQPYNSNLLFGTGDFTISFWMYSNRPTGNTYGDIVSWGSIPSFTYTNANRYIFFQVWGNQNGGNPHLGIYFKTSTGNSGLNFREFPKNVWHKHTLVRRSGAMYHYINTALVTSSSTSATAGDFNPSADTNAHVLRVGWQGTLYNYPAQYEQIALLHVSKTALTDNDIKRIFEDEKFLFQENAACTLYGSSDAVTALAYDDKTNLLHVGTSSGRSDFRGLRRINNTTTGITTAISASNKLIAEQ